MQLHCWQSTTKTYKSIVDAFHWDMKSSLWSHESKKLCLLWHMMCSFISIEFGQIRDYHWKREGPQIATVNKTWPILFLAIGTPQLLKIANWESQKFSMECNKELSQGLQWGLVVMLKENVQRMLVCYQQAYMYTVRLIPSYVLTQSQKVIN